MRIAAIKNHGKATLAVRRNGELIDLGIAAPKLPRDLGALVAGGQSARSEERRVGKECRL